MPLLLISLIFTSLLNAEEPSAFGAGDLDNPTPYGLTKNEKEILQNRKEIQSLKSNVFTLQNSLNEVKESSEGLKSVFQGEITKFQDIFLSINSLDEKIEKNRETIELLQKDLNTTTSDLIDTLNKNIEIQNKNIDKLSSAIKDMGKIVDKIDREYITRLEVEVLVEELKRALLADKSNESSKENRIDLSGKENFEIFQEASKLFKENKLEESRVRFEHSIDNNYKPATSSYYLGEISFMEKRYEDAVFYYKKSASLYDKADYMPKLLLNTAISFEKIGQKENAKKFYDTLISLYKDSNEAKVAKENLTKL